MVTGMSIRIKDNKIDGRISAIHTALFCEYPLNSSIKEGTFARVLQIEGINRRKYFRLATQVEITGDISELSLSDKFEEEINDYLLDMSDSNEFDILITKDIINIGIINFFVEIKFKNKMNLDTVSLFFRNINTLEKRLSVINGYKLDIEDLNKNGIKIKIYKTR